jgi:hypothetical protein
VALAAYLPSTGLLDVQYFEVCLAQKASVSCCCSLANHAPNAAEKIAVEKTIIIAFLQDRPCGVVCVGHDSSDDRTLPERSFSQSSACVVSSGLADLLELKPNMLEVAVAESACVNGVTRQSQNTKLLKTQQQLLRSLTPPRDLQAVCVQELCFPRIVIQLLRNYPAEAEYDTRSTIHSRLPVAHRAALALATFLY